MANKKTTIDIKQAISHFGSGNFTGFSLQSTRYLASPLKANLNDTKQQRLVKSYSGKEFALYSIPTTQFDLLVNCAIMKLMKAKKARATLHFSFPELLHSLNRKDGSKIRTLILKSIQKHSQTYIDIEFENGNNFHGYKIKSFKELTKNNFEYIWDEKWLEACYFSRTCSVDFNILLKLHPGLQSWLYGFISASPELKSIDIDTLHQLSGVNYKNLQDFRKAVKSSLDTLYNHGCINWQHGITRDGIVFWLNRLLLD